MTVIVLDCPWRLRHILIMFGFFKTDVESVCMLEDTCCSCALYLSLHSAFSWIFFVPFCAFHM